MVQHAIFQGYGQRLMKGQFPVAVLFLKVPTHTLDVNVHPTKHEVRFSEQKKLHDSIQFVIEETLNRWENSIKWQVHNDNQSDSVRILESSDTFTQAIDQQSTRHSFPKHLRHPIFQNIPQMLLNYPNPFRFPFTGNRTERC
jgi:DNA mismatch repair ATPase MutL